MPQTSSSTPRIGEFVAAATARGEGSQARFACAAVGLKGLLLRARKRPLADLHPTAVNFFAVILAEYSRALPEKDLLRLLALFETAETLFLNDIDDALKAFK